jgi:DNA-binding response OmpR family regulator
MRVLIAEDERQLRETLSRGLREASYAVDQVANGEEAIGKASSTHYDAIILDVLMPKGNGILACRAIRGAGVDVPILMLTALDSLDDKIRGLDAGADDYLTKPFQFAELLARLRALTRRRPELHSTELVVGDLVIDTGRRDARRGDRDIPLTSKEFAFIECLARNSGRIVSRAELHAHVWSDNQTPFSNLIDVYASRLRKKIDDGEEIALLTTQRSVGYMLSAGTSGTPRVTPPRGERAVRAGRAPKSTRRSPS